MGVCQTVLPWLSNPFTYLGVGGVGIGLKLLYSYSSFTFWPSILSASAIWRTLMTTISGVTSVLRTDLLKYAAAVTTFSQTLTYLLTGNISMGKLFSTVGTELYDKVVLTLPNLVEGLGFFSEWISMLGPEGVCGLTGNTGLFFSGLQMIWISVAAYIFVLWIWKSTWYDWRNVEMESQEKWLVVALITVVSLSAHGTSLLAEGLSNGVSLADTLAQAGGDVWSDLGVSDPGVNSSVNQTK